MMKRNLIVLLLTHTLTTSTFFGDTIFSQIVTKDGQTYNDVKVSSVSEKDILIIYDRGVETLDLELLPEDVIKALGVTTLSKSVSSYAVSPEPSESEKIKDQLKLLAKVEDDARRLKAYDDFSKSLGIEISSDRQPTPGLQDAKWKIQYFVDDFGEKTSDAYLTNKYKITGTFSNSATQDSKLQVRFIITLDGVFLKLFEYARNNPVKAYRTDYYSVSIRDGSGKDYSLTARNYSDRLRFGEKSYILNKIFAEGGIIKFSIREKDSLSAYNFQVDAGKGYAQMLRNLP